MRAPVARARLRAPLARRQGARLRAPLAPGAVSTGPAGGLPVRRRLPACPTKAGRLKPAPHKSRLHRVLELKSVNIGALLWEDEVDFAPVFLGGGAFGGPVGGVV